MVRVSHTRNTKTISIRRNQSSRTNKLYEHRNRPIKRNSRRASSRIRTNKNNPHKINPKRTQRTKGHEQTPARGLCHTRQPSTTAHRTPDNRRQPDTIGDEPPELPKTGKLPCNIAGAADLPHRYLPEQATKHDRPTSRTDPADIEHRKHRHRQHRQTSQPLPRHRRYASATGLLGIYKGVSVCVVLWSLCVGDGNVLAKKKTAKKEACVSGVLVVVVNNRSVC